MVATSSGSTLCSRGEGSGKRAVGCHLVVAADDRTACCCIHHSVTIRCPSSRVHVREVVYVDSTTSRTLDGERYVRDVDVILLDRNVNILGIHIASRLCQQCCVGRGLLQLQVLGREDDVWDESVHHHSIVVLVCHVDALELYLGVCHLMQLCQAYVRTESLGELVASQIDWQNETIPLILFECLVEMESHVLVGVGTTILSLIVQVGELVSVFVQYQVAIRGLAGI